MTNGREVLLQAFDRLFAKAADKLQVPYTEEDLANAKAHFQDRFAGGLEAANVLQIDSLPDEVLEEMEQAIEDLSPVEVVAQLAVLPLAHKAKELLRALRYRGTESQLIEYALQQADDTYGGN